MSFFGGFYFFIVLIVLLIPAIIMGICEIPLKIYSTALSVIFIWLVYCSKTNQLFFLVAFVFLTLYLVKLYIFLRNKYGRNKILYIHAMILALLPLVAVKLLPKLSFSGIGFLGISYVTFKVIQIIIETYDGVIKDISAFDYVSFIIFFPSLSSGPIDRSRRYIGDLTSKLSRDDYLSLLENGLFKILLGIAYKFVFSSIAFRYLITEFAHNLDFLHVIGYSYCYGIYMFFDFAGYSLMAVGTSYILGICTPDNFDKPFISIDMKDFWNRWHISLSHWFRDFVFSRFMMDSIRKKRFKTKLTGASVGLILNMLIMGVWHGLEVQYIVYGLYHGVLLAATEVYQKKSKFYAANKKKPWYKVLSWFVTLNLVMLGFLIFSGHIKAVFKSWYL